MNTLNAEEFRQRLAGLSDVAASNDINPDTFRELSSDIVLLLAICFNRQQLDAITLWERINGAIERGLAESNGDDIERFVSTALSHVLANVSTVASNLTAYDIQSRLYDLDEPSRIYAMQYLAKHVYPAIVHGRKKWEQHKVTKGEK